MTTYRYYGIYRGVRNSSWSCLLEFNVNKLPVDVLSIARAAEIRVIKNSSVDSLLPGETGKSYSDGQHWVIIYDDKASTETARFTVAHELGHVFLGHELKTSKHSHLKEVKHTSKSEQEADSFALRLLCPACAIWGLGLTDAGEISSYCYVDKDVASKRAQRMTLLYERNKFLSSPLERKVYGLFEPFILELKQKSTVENNIKG